MLSTVCLSGVVALKVLVSVSNTESNSGHRKSSLL